MGFTITCTGVFGKTPRPSDNGTPWLINAWRPDRDVPAPRAFCLTDFSQVVLGRRTLCDGDAGDAARRRTLRLAVADEHLSSSHALISRAAEGWLLEDRGSKNGTYLNGRSVTRELLHDGDLIELGTTLYVFHVAGQPPCYDQPGALPRALHTVSPRLAIDFSRLAKVAPSRLPILLRGETGCGKEVTARAIHELSGRSGPFVAVNCGALPKSLLESELFGVRKGAFSGAVQDRIGLVRAAHRGTLLLDEIAEMDASAQVALLRVLQENQVVPIGATTPIGVDVRIIAATHQNLEQRIELGTFREDLFGRLGGHELVLPPLRKRKEDLGPLIAAILGEPLRLSRFAVLALFRYHWPRNIRELMHVLEAATLFADGQPICEEHLPPAVRAVLCNDDSPPHPSLRAPEHLRGRMLQLLTAHHGNIAAVARDVGKKRQQVQRWLHHLEIDPELFRS